MSFLTWLKNPAPQRAAGAATHAGGLPARLQTYRPYVPPHGGPSTGWTAAQAEDNLTYLLTQREERLGQLAALLGEAGMDMHPALHGEPPDALLAQLHAWRLAQWPALRASLPAAVPAASRITSRRHAEVAYSLVMDLAILLGELIVRRRAPAMDWAVNMEAASVDDAQEGRAGQKGRRTARREHTDSWKRPVVLVRRQHLPLPRTDMPLDVEGAVLASLRHIDAPKERYADDWATLVHNALSGAYERPV